MQTYPLVSYWQHFCNYLKMSPDPHIPQLYLSIIMIHTHKAANSILSLLLFWHVSVSLDHHQG